MMGTGSRGGMRAAVVAAVGAVVVLGAGPASADLRNTLRTAPTAAGVPDVATERYQNAADALLETGIRNLPIHPAASPAYTYRYDPDCHCYKKVPTPVGPWFITERGHTLGKGLLNIGFTFGEYNLRDAFGCTLGEDRKPLRISSGAVTFRAGTELIYQVATLGVVYGVTDDLDVSVELPVAAIDFGVNASARGGTTGGSTFASHHEDIGPNIMDTRVGAKYRLWSSGPWTLAGGGRARIPTGDPNEGFGTGDGEVGPYLALEGDFWNGILGSFVDAGFDLDVTDTHRSSGHWGTGVTAQPPVDTEWHRLAFVGEIVGRHEIDGVRALSSVSGPHVGGNCAYLCLDPSRQDYFDAVIGVRVRLVRSLVMSLGVFKPINENDGVRPAGFSPVGSIEATF